MDDISVEVGRLTDYLSPPIIGNLMNCGEFTQSRPIRGTTLLHG